MTRKEIFNKILSKTTIHYYVTSIYIVFKIRKTKEFKELNVSFLTEIANEYAEKFNQFESNIIGAIIAWWLSYAIIATAIFF